MRWGDYVGDDECTPGKVKWVKFYDSDTGELLFSSDFGNCIQDVKIERRNDTMTKELLIELKEKLETMQNAINEEQYMIDSVVEDNDEDRNLDLKVIVRLNRVEAELDDCFEMIIEDNL